MKKMSIILFAALALACACADKSKKAAIELPAADVAANADSVVVNRDREMTVKDTIEWRGNVYYSEIHRYPVDSAGFVSDEFGDLYADNYISLKITSQNKVFYENTFKKTAFRSLMSADVYDKFCLNGLMFDNVTDGGLSYSASVGNPSQEDEFVPFTITISASGNTSVSETYDTNLPERIESED